MPIAISISSGSYYRINGGIYTDKNGTVSNGNTVEVAHNSSENELTNVSSTLTIGDVNGTFTSTTASKDTVPDNNFSFPGKTSLIYGIIESNSTVISGINAPTPISISAGSYYQINGGSYTDANGTLTNGNTVRVRHISSENFSTSVSTTLTIGGVSGTFISTRAENNTTLVETVDVMAYGATGNGEDDDSSAIQDAYNVAKAQGKNVYFPAGTYLCYTFVNAQGVRFIGEDKNTTIIKGLSDNESLLTLHNVDGAENITFENYRIGDYDTAKHRLFKNCAFHLINSSGVDLSGYYMLTTGFSNTRWNGDDEFIDCNFVFPRIYIALFISKYDSVSIRNCTFNGDAVHNIRLSDAYNRNPQVSIIGNTIVGGKTGIFIGSDRVFPKEAGLIEGNTLRNQWEEGISLDSFGNNPGKVPVIADGQITNVWNDLNGRVVISMNEMVYMDSNKHPASSPVSLRNNWTNFYFSFGKGSGLEGIITKIYSFDNTNNTLTLDNFTSSININEGGDIGVQAGFYNWIVRDNTLSEILGSDKLGYDYGTALSIYLNVFGTLVENNTVYDSAHGLNIAGGLMENSVRALAYNNIARNNTFQNCDITGEGEPSERRGVVRFNSTYGGPIQYNNKFINNTIDNTDNRGRMFVQQQGNFTFEDNNLTNVELLIVDPISTP